MTRALTTESTILPNAAPMITPMARSIALPLTAKSRNSLRKPDALLMNAPYVVRPELARRYNPRLLCCYISPQYGCCTPDATVVRAHQSGSAYASEIGRATCREIGCLSVTYTGVADQLQQKNHKAEQ